MLGAGLALARSGAVAHGRVRLLFQPAEEAIPGGAAAMVEAGLVDGAGAIFALHCDPNLEVGAIGLSPGPITSAADLVDIRVKGPGGHTARPHRTVDVVHVIAKLATDLPAGLAKLSDSRDAVNLTFGAIEAGDASNVIPTEGRLRGSLRAGGRSSWEQAGPKLRTLIAAIAEPFGATWELDHLVGAPPDRQRPLGGRRSWRRPRRPTCPGRRSCRRCRAAGARTSRGSSTGCRGAYARLGVRTPGAPVVDIHAERVRRGRAGDPARRPTARGFGPGRAGRPPRRLTRPP